MSPVSGVIRPAENDAELEDIYRLRAEVFFGEHILKFGRTERLTDELDRHPASVNLVVAAGPGGSGPRRDVVGAVRLTFPAPELDTTRSAYFDFAPFVQGEQARTAAGSMLCVHPDYRRSRLGTTLTRSIMEIARRHSMRYLCVAARPISLPFLLELGWDAVAPRFDHPVELVPVIPMVVDLTAAATTGEADRRLGQQFVLT